MADTRPRGGAAKGPTPDDRSPRERLLALRETTEARLAALGGTFDEVVAASADANADDEHDPEGSTIGFERAQVAALTASARRTLEEVDAALDRLAAGTYGTCLRCGRPIAPARLAARPTATLCVTCAQATGRSRG
jgi:DnaK suppressor protein